MTQRYHHYVFSAEERKFRGDFEAMYGNEEAEGFDSWFQDDVTHPVRRLSLALLEGYNFARVLDIGCGKGTFTHLLKRRNNYVKGLDISATAVKRARARYPTIEFAEVDLNHIEGFGDERFDLTISMAVLYYVEEWRRVLEMVARATDYFYLTLYIPPDTMGFIKNFDEFLEEATRHFTPEHHVVLNQHTFLWLGRSKG
jgi:SAM-dependent methyltransferase